ncbi:hypothetical protein G7074_26160 [Pedobacter sp. HDW13]|uniref:hypothetical protein n=1 Tax=unclassified Pedobacter TaxID=2628915 RepID=UPI000F5A13B3|nr:MULTISPECIES: hypothetical protein [unclassified Pedobacter]QIL42438.1 hypothetical protein G7074_26160 [Pedobacter sp. HDW13]RQO78918.1 hypothetical protein DBR40_04115 [Pedobacter sp. KBW01]
MLKKTTLILLLIIGVLKLNAQNKWFKQQITEKVSVSFPTQPRKVNETSYAIKDSTGIIYVSSRVDLLPITQLDLATLNAEIEKQKFADDFVVGISGSFPKYKFESPKLIMVSGQRAYAVVARDEVNKLSLFMNVCFLDGTSYSFSCILPDGKSVKYKDIFLSTIWFKN